ncbi:Cation transporter like protein [Aduncisulcus paluster]|uniref:Cation transporter like protein n=1 Tax=Aduncisulcus paluster TaxID=2918883 RepID=A0ABQ5KQP7_9EUKA|nr:Cation transporter like protein [Aduncisulcus paluster]
MKVDSERQFQFPYFRVHLLWYIFLALFFGTAIYITEYFHNYRSSKDVPWLDGVFTSTSALTVTGLLAVSFSDMCLMSQILTLICIQLGSASMMSMAPLLFRRLFLRRRFSREIVLMKNTNIPSPFHHSHSNSNQKTRNQSTRESVHIISADDESPVQSSPLDSQLPTTSHSHRRRRRKRHHKPTSGTIQEEKDGLHYQSSSDSIQWKDLESQDGSTPRHASTLPHSSIIIKTGEESSSHDSFEEEDHGIRARDMQDPTLFGSPSRDDASQDDHIPPSALSIPSTAVQDFEHLPSALYTIKAIHDASDDANKHKAASHEPAPRSKMLYEFFMDYRASGILLVAITTQILATYFVCWLCLYTYIKFSSKAQDDIMLGGYTGSVGWWCLFHVISAFNNAGFSLMPDNLLYMQRHPFIQTVIGFLIAAGNTLFPVMLRLTIWMQAQIYQRRKDTRREAKRQARRIKRRNRDRKLTGYAEIDSGSASIQEDDDLEILRGDPQDTATATLSLVYNSIISDDTLNRRRRKQEEKLLKELDEDEEEDVFAWLLTDARSCYTHLFPAHENFMLFMMWFVFTIVEWFAFLMLDMNTASFQYITPFNRAFCGLFQAVSTRSAGFNVLNLANLSDGLNVLYTGMMIVAPYPFISVLQSSMKSAPEEIKKETRRLKRELWKEKVKAEEEERMRDIAAEKKKQKRREERLKRKRERHAQRLAEQMSSYLDTDVGDTEATEDTQKETQSRTEAQTSVSKDSKGTLTKVYNSKEIPQEISKTLFPSSLGSQDKKITSDKVVLQTDSQGQYGYMYVQSRKGSISNDVHKKSSVSLKKSSKKSSYSSEDIWEKIKKVMSDIGVAYRVNTFERDLALIFIAWTLICCCESESMRFDLYFTPFMVIFELASAYGNVGLSLGHPNAISLSAYMNHWSRVFIMLVMLLGRHRGLPQNIDSVVSISLLSRDAPSVISRHLEVRKIKREISKIQVEETIVYDRLSKFLQMPRFRRSVFSGDTMPALSRKYSIDKQDSWVVVDDPGIEMSNSYAPADARSDREASEHRRKVRKEKEERGAAFDDESDDHHTDHAIPLLPFDLETK